MPEKVASSGRATCIVCGAGETGLSVIRELSERDLDITAVDIDPDALKAATAVDDAVRTVTGNCKSDVVLKEAGVEKATALFAVLPDDRSNVFLSLSAGRINPNLKIYSIASDSTASRKLRLVGARRTVNPNTAEGLRISSELVRPSVSRFLNMLVYSQDDRGEGTPGYICVAVPEGSFAAGRTLGDAGVHMQTGVIIVAVESPDGSILYSPTADSRIEVGDRLIAFGTEEERSAVADLLARQAEALSGPRRQKHRLFSRK